MTESSRLTLDAVADFTHHFGLLVEQGTKRIGLTPVRARLLHAVAQLSPCRQREIAAAAEMTAQQTAVLLDSLTALGLIQRNPNPDDRRAVLVELTDAGHERVREIDAMRNAIADRLLGHLEPCAQESLTHTLRELTERAVQAAR